MENPSSIFNRLEKINWLFEFLNRSFSEFLYNEEVDKWECKENIESTIKTLRKDYGFTKEDISYEMRFRYKKVF